MHIVSPCLPLNHMLSCNALQRRIAQSLKRSLAIAINGPKIPDVKKDQPQRSINIDLDFSEVGENGVRHPKIIISASTVDTVNNGMKELEKNADVSFVESRLLASGPENLKEALMAKDSIPEFNSYCPGCTSQFLKQGQKVKETQSNEPKWCPP